MCQSLFFDKVAGGAGVFPLILRNIANTFLTEDLRKTTSVSWDSHLNKKSASICNTLKKVFFTYWKIPI